MTITRLALVRRRRGSTIIELVVALALTAILAGASLRLVDFTHRFARGSILIGEERAQLAAAAHTLRPIIQELSADGADLTSASDSALTFYGTIGAAIACRLSSTAVELPPENLASNIPLTAWAMSPQPGDQIALLDEGQTIGSGDDRWFLSRLVGASRVANGCSGTAYVSAADAGKSGWTLQLADTIPATVVPGAPLRTRRHQRVALYRSGSQWMMGWTDWNAATGAWNTIQPLVGPLQPYAPPPAAGGLAFAWLDSVAAPVVLPSSALASVRLDIRGRTTAAVRMAGATNGIRGDSLGARIPLRNRR